MIDSRLCPYGLRRGKQENMAKDNDKEFLEFVVKELVDNPKDVKVERKVDEMGVLLSLKVNPEDMGQIIGRKDQQPRQSGT